MTKKVDERVIVRKPKSKRNYINSDDLHKNLISYYEDCRIRKQDGKTAPQIPKYIGECIIQIAEKLASKINFANYTYKDEMIGDAIEKMVEAVNNQKFDPSLSSNPFGYYSQIAWNCFLQRIEKEKKQTYIKHKNFDAIFSSVEDIDDLNVTDMKNNDDHNRIIEDFEKPKDKAGYTVHKNLSYEKNRAKHKKD